MPHRIEVGFRVLDTRASARETHLAQLSFGNSLREVFIVDVYTIDKDFSIEDLQKIGSALSNPVLQEFTIDKPYGVPEFDWAIEIGFLPGVTDNVGHTVKEIVQDLLSATFEEQEAVYSSQITYVRGDLTSQQAEAIGESMANKLIQRITVKSYADYQRDSGMGVLVPRVKLNHEPQVDEVDLDMSDEELTKLGKQGVPNADGTRRGPLALSLPYVHAIKDYFEDWRNSEVKSQNEATMKAACEKLHSV